MINQPPQEINQDEDDFHQCCAAQTGSTTGSNNCEQLQNIKAQFFIDELNKDDEEFDEINQQLNKVYLEDQHKPSLIQAFQADMSAYQSHEKLTKNSRKMQQEYQNANQQDREYAFRKFIKDNIENIALDKYMHFILEKILEIGKYQQNNPYIGLLNHKIQILERLYGSIGKLVKDLYACKVIQKGLDIMTQYPKELGAQLEKYVSFIVQDNMFIKKLYVDRIANQLFQKSLEVLEGKKLQKLLDVLSQYILRDSQFELSTDQYGCLIVNKIIDIYPKQFDQYLKKTCHEIILRSIQNSSCLTRRQYANYIIQQILEKGQEQHKRILMDQYLLKDFVSMSMDKYGSNVAEKAIIYGGVQWRHKLWEEEISISESTLKKLVNDQFANYPIQRLYEYQDQSTRTEFLGLLNKLQENNLLNHHGQIVLKFALTNFTSRKHAQRLTQSEFSKQSKTQEKNKQQKQSQNQHSHQQSQQTHSQQQSQQQINITHQHSQSQHIIGAKSCPQPSTSTTTPPNLAQFDYQAYYMYSQMLMYQQQMMMSQQQLQQQYNYMQQAQQYPQYLQQQQQQMMQFMQEQQKNNKQQ